MPLAATATIDAGTDAALPGVRKAAVLLLTLGEAEAAQVLKRLPAEAVESVSREIARIGQVPTDVRTDVYNEFYHLALANSYLAEGGLDYAKRLLRASLGEEAEARSSSRCTQQVQTTPFSFLQKADSENLMTFIQDEHPQTIALILAHLPQAKASEILVGLPGAKQVEVIKRIANMETTNPEVIREVERGLEHRLSDLVSQSFEKTGGVESVAEILNLADRATEKGIMEGLEADDPELVESIRRLMFVFEDVMLVPDKGIQKVLKDVDNETLSLALKMASEDLKAKIFKNMSERASKLIQEDMQYMGPVRVSDVEAAQQKVVDIVRRLEDAGDIVIEGRGGDGLGADGVRPASAISGNLANLKSSDHARHQVRRHSPRYAAFSMTDIEQEAAALLEGAKRRSVAILEQARQQAAEQRQKGYDAGLAKGREEGHAEGYAKGREEGQATAYAEQREALAALADSMTSVLRGFNDERARLATAATDEVPKLAVAIAERVCKRAGRLDPEVCAANATAALRLVMRSHDVKLHAHPKDCENLKTLLPTIQKRWPALTHVELVEDANLARGGCRVHTEGGLVDADLKTQLDRVAADLVPGDDA